MDDLALKRDQEKIDKIKKSYDLNKLSDVEKVYSQLISGNIKFETRLGDEFDDYIYELREKLKNSTDNKKEKKQTKNIKPEKKSYDQLDENMKKLVDAQVKNQEKKRKRLVAILSVLCILCFGSFIYYYVSVGSSEKRFNDLSKLKGSNALNNKKDDKTSVNAHLSNDEFEVPDVIDKYITLYNSNKSLIGWLKIDDTNIDYPVMQCGDNTYYLTHNFDQKEDKAGALFLDTNCDVIRGNDNYIIYGHHLTSGRMFSSLPNYEKQSFYEKHKYITFDTIYKEHVYQVMYAFRSKLYNEDDVVFKYYQFIDANSEEEFNSYMNEMKTMSFYDTGVTASYGDKLLTLSTCDYHEENGRFVVVAKMIK